MAKTKAKSGSKVKASCPICGKVLTRAGLIGHMRWTHKRDAKAPLIPIEHPLTEARRKAVLYESLYQRLMDGRVLLGVPDGKPKGYFRLEGDKLTLRGVDGELLANCAFVMKS